LKIVLLGGLFCGEGSVECFQVTDMEHEWSGSVHPKHTAANENSHFPICLQPELSLLWHVQFLERWQSTVYVIDIPFQFCYFSYASLRVFGDSSFLLIVLIARIGGFWENVLCWVSSGPSDKTGEHIHVPGEPTVCNFAHVLFCCIVHCALHLLAGSKTDLIDNGVIHIWLLHADRELLWVIIVDHFSVIQRLPFLGKFINF